MIFPPQRGQARPLVVRFSTSILSKSSSAISTYSPRCLLRMMKMEQKIETGGTSNTRTPMLKFLMNLPLPAPASEALHITHWASPGTVRNNMTPATNTINVSIRQFTNFIMAPRRAQAPPAVTPGTDTVNPMSGNCPGKTPSTSRCRSPALALTSGSS